EATGGGFQSPWFLLYIFPIMSASRFLGSARSIGIAIFATLAYGFAIHVFTMTGTQAISFYLRGLMFVGVAFTAGNLARTRDIAESKLVSAIEKIDREILSTTDPVRVMTLILNTAMEITHTDL